MIPVGAPPLAAQAPPDSTTLSYRRGPEFYVVENEVSRGRQIPQYRIDLGGFDTEFEANSEPLVAGTHGRRTNRIVASGLR
jgi:hypothetical protein